jgi:hypothetical protein
MKHGLVKDIHFVYDYDPKPGKNCWTKEQILSLIKAGYEDSLISSLMYSEEKAITDRNSATVDHPLFGIVPRAGWAQFKIQSFENTFSINNLLLIHMMFDV